MSQKNIIGRAEKIAFVDHGIVDVPAKVDTGADSSSVWACDISVDKYFTLRFKLFAPESHYYTGEVIEVPYGQYRVLRVYNSFGDDERRYAPKLRVRVSGRIVRASFSLSSRQHKTYPVLLGRHLLRNKFLVDVATGDPLPTEKYSRKSKTYLIPIKSNANLLRG